MKDWLLFSLFIVVGLGILFSGIVYMVKEKNDPGSEKFLFVLKRLNFKRFSP